MPRYFPGMLVTLKVNVTVSDTLTDAPSVYFKYKEGLYGTENTLSPTHDGTGIYEVSFIPQQGGDVYYRWDTDGSLDTAQEGILNVAPTNFTIT